MATEDGTRPRRPTGKRTAGCPWPPVGGGWGLVICQRPCLCGKKRGGQAGRLRNSGWHERRPCGAGICPGLTRGRCTQGADALRGAASPHGGLPANPRAFSGRAGARDRRLPEASQAPRPAQENDGRRIWAAGPKAQPLALAAAAVPGKPGAERPCADCQLRPAATGHQRNSCLPQQRTTGFGGLRWFLCVERRARGCLLRSGHHAIRGRGGPQDSNPVLASSTARISLDGGP